MNLIPDRFVLIITVTNAILPLVCQHINSYALTKETLGFESTSHVDIYCTAPPTRTLAYPCSCFYTHSEQVSQQALQTSTKYTQPFCSHHLPLSARPFKEERTLQ